jgi:hypothetical protein
VEEAVVVPAQQDEVVEAGLSSPEPVNDVMGVAEDGRPITAPEPAMPVAEVERLADRR